MKYPTFILFVVDAWRRHLRSYQDFRKLRWCQGKGTSVDSRSRVGGKVFIGDYTIINGPCLLAAHKGARIEIGKWCAIAYNLRVRATNHVITRANLQQGHSQRFGFSDVHGISRGDIVIGNASWLGDNVTLLPGSGVGDGAIVGAGSVVTKPIPPFAIAVGNPARVIRYRFSEEMIAWLQELQWWEWDLDRMGRNREFFELDLTLATVAEAQRTIVR